MRWPEKTIEQRFEEKYAPIPESGCWLWLGALDRGGYGEFFGIKNFTKAHRVSWWLHNGDVPKGVGVLHRCDVPSCVNPNHLFLGSPQINVFDMRAKGRAYDSVHHKEKTHCPHGHEYSEENTYRYRGRRNRRACSAEKMRRRRAAQ